MMNEADKFTWTAFVHDNEIPLRALSLTAFTSLVKAKSQGNEFTF